GDSDGDGLPDDWELANGLDPNNPVDALDDQDDDGLSTIAEYQSGLNPFNGDTDGDGLKDGREVVELQTNPLLTDTDGDGLRDGLDVQPQSDPLDPNSFNLAAALQSIEVSPASFTLIFNTVLGEASRQLRVTGRLIDGNSLDITSRRYGTSYGSGSLAIANFGAEDGRIYAGQNGTATISVLNNGHAAASQVTVRSFAPTLLGSVVIPSYPIAEAVEGSYAYVAAIGIPATVPGGPSPAPGGLYVVDVADPTAPQIVGFVAVGDALDVVVEEAFAYVVNASGDLVVVDIGNPAAPAVVTTLHIPAGPKKLALQGQ